MEGDLRINSLRMSNNPELFAAKRWTMETNNNEKDLVMQKYEKKISELSWNSNEVVCSIER